MAALDAPSIDMLNAAWAKAEAQNVFWHEHRNELLAQYPDQFVAASTSEVVAASADLQALLRELAERGIGRSEVRIRFISTDPQRFML